MGHAVARRGPGIQTPRAEPRAASLEPRASDKSEVSGRVHRSAMPRQSERVRHANEVATEMRAWVGRELRTARRASGVSQAAAAASAGMSRSQFGRIERAAMVRLRIDQAVRAFTAVGLRLAMSGYPDGDPARDAGQQRVFVRLRPLVPIGGRVRTEVPLPIPGDRRAWDVTIDLRARRAGCELEAKLRDVQATERRLALKLRDGGVDIVILVLADTKANRELLALHREAAAARLRADPGRVPAWRAARRERDPVRLSWATVPARWIGPRCGLWSGQDRGLVRAHRPRRPFRPRHRSGWIRCRTRRRTRTTHGPLGGPTTRCRTRTTHGPRGRRLRGARSGRLTRSGRAGPGGRRPRRAGSRCPGRS